MSDFHLLPNPFIVHFVEYSARGTVKLDRNARTRLFEDRAVVELLGDPCFVAAAVDVGSGQRRDGNLPLVGVEL